MYKVYCTDSEMLSDVGSRKKKAKKRYVHTSLGVNILKPVCDPKSCNGSTSKSNLIHSDDLI